MSARYFELDYGKFRGSDSVSTMDEWVNLTSYVIIWFYVNTASGIGHL